MIATFATENYYKYLCLLIESYKFFNQDDKVVIYSVNWSEETKKDLNLKFKNIEILDLPLTDVLLENLNTPGPKGELIRQKPWVILDIYKKNKEPFIWIDADTVVLGSLSPLINKLKTNKFDFMCTHRPNHEKDYAKFAVGVLAFSKSKKGEDILVDYVKKTNEINGVDGWFQEQLSLYEVYKNSKYVLYPLSESEHSIRKNENTLILSKREGFEYESLLSSFIKKKNCRLRK